MSDSDSKLGSAITGISVESKKGIASAMKTAGTDNKEGSYSELYKLNQVWYATPPSLSIVSKRTLVRNQFQRTSYTSPDRHHGLHLQHGRVLHCSENQLHCDSAGFQLRQYRCTH